MKITLLMPQSDMYRKGGIFPKALRYAPLTLTTLAALIPEELNATIKCHDEASEVFDPETCDADIVGITVITPTSKRAYAFAKKLRARGVFVVLGGVHVTLVPDEAIKHADAIVTGYAEETWPQLLRDFAKKQTRKRYDQGHSYQFQSVPIPRRDLLNRKPYVTMNTVQAVRGCPYKCTFCVVPSAWPQYMHRPIKEVIAEIEALDGDTFLFLDLSPVEDRKYIKDLYRALIPLKKKWGGLSTFTICKDREMLELASKSGCRGLLIGIESVNPSTLHLMKKGFNKPDSYHEQIKMLHDHGVAVNGCFVFGLDEDNKDVFDRTADFAIETAIDLPRFAVATPFPGTPFFKQLQSEKRIQSYDWSLYSGQHVLFEPKQMTAEELHRGIRRTWKEVYRLGSVWKRIFSSDASRDWDLLKVSIPANLGYAAYSKFLPPFISMSCGEEDMWMPEMVGQSPIILNKL